MDVVPFRAVGKIEHEVRVQKTSQAVNVLLPSGRQRGAAQTAYLIKPLRVFNGDGQKIAANRVDGALNHIFAHWQCFHPQNGLTQQEQQIAEVSAANGNQAVRLLVRGTPCAKSSP